MTKFREVTEAEFAAFLEAYPRPLERSVLTICEPWMAQYNDFKRAPFWPDSVVASHAIDGGYDLTKGPHGWRVIEDIDSPVEDDGRRDCSTPLYDSFGAELKEGDEVEAEWGGSFDHRTGEFTSKVRREKILIREAGTKYEHWSFESCHNLVRGFKMRKIESGKDAP